MEVQFFHASLSVGVLIFIMAGGFLAGFVDSIAGGGGLVSLPVLMAAGLPPHLALGTNKFSATFGAVMSAWQFFKAGKVDRHLMKRALPCTFIGAVLGCLVMLHMSAEWLQPLIILSLMAAAVVVLRGAISLGQYLCWRDRKKPDSHGSFCRRHRFYDGFAGPGTGPFSSSPLSALGFDFVTAAGNAKMLNLMSNITAFVILVWSGTILYVYGVVMALCIFTGAFFGSRLAIRRGTGFVRVVMLVVTAALIGKLGLSYFGIL